MSARRADADESLVRIRDLAGRPRGTGFVADDRGTVITSHEAVDGLARLVLHAPGERTCLVGVEAVTPLPGADLALVRTEGLCVPPLPVAGAECVEGGTKVRLRAGRWQTAQIIGDALVIYTATDRFHLLGAALELSLGERDGLRLGEEATGGPVIDARTGAVVAVLGTALHTEHRAGGFAIPLRAAAATSPDGPLAALLERNAATVPAYGPELNLAGGLQLTATSLGPATASLAWSEPVARPETDREFARFLSGDDAASEGPGGASNGVGAGPGDCGQGSAAPPGSCGDACPDARRCGEGSDSGGGCGGPSWASSCGDQGCRHCGGGGGRPDGPVAEADTTRRGDSRDPDDGPPDPPNARSRKASVLGLVGDPGTGRTTQLAALAGRRTRGDEPAPTVWLRGADLRVGDESVRDAVARVLETAGRIVTASAGADGTVGDPTDATPEAVAEMAHRVGRPLLILLDGPEEMPPGLAHALAGWTAATADWLEKTATRLIIACRPEHWETAGALFPPDALHVPSPASHPRALPPCALLTDLAPGQAAEARAAYGLAPDALSPADACHPLALRLLAEVRAALPDGHVRGGAEDRAPDRWDVFSAHLDLVCLRIAVRLAAARTPPPRGAAVRRLATRVAGQVHEAARRCLGPGQGELEREAFEELFPWRTGWASAVLTEGLLVPAGAGYRFAHEEFSDWLQGAHLDLDTALHALVHHWYEPEGTPGEAAARLPSRREEESARTPAARRRSRRGGDAGRKPSRPLPVPRHRIGPVLQALFLLARRSGPAELARRLGALVHAVETLPLRSMPAPEEEGAEPHAGATAADTVPADGEEAPRTVPDPVWWAAHLLGEALLRVPDATPYLDVLRLLAERVTARSLAHGGFDGGATRTFGGLAEFGPWFWLRLPLGTADRLELLRVLIPADGPPPGPAAPAPQRPSPQPDRFLTAVATVLSEDPCTAQPLLCRWFGDDRPLQTTPDGGATGFGVRPTVSAAAQALLHTHRRRAVDDLAEALVDAAHPHADELLSALAEDEPSALCRAVDRWAHHDRVDRHVAAAAYALKAAPHVTTEADRQLLRYSALALLDRPAEGTLHGAALALLVRDRQTRSKHLPQAIARFTSGDPHLPPGALAAALTTHPEPVLAAFRARLYQPGEGPGDVLRTLAEVTTPALARRAAALVREHLEHHPEGAAHVAAFVDRRLEAGPAGRAVLFPLVADLLRTHPAQVRRALAPVLAAPGTPVSRPLRQELLEVLLECEQYGPHERDVTVLDTLLRAVVSGAGERGEARTRDLVHRTGLLMARTPEGAACFDRRLTQLARDVPAFGAQVRGWLRTAPAQWAVVVGPAARIRLTAGGDPAGGAGAGPPDAAPPPEPPPPSEDQTEVAEGSIPDTAADSADPMAAADLASSAPADANRRLPAWHS
ncbi:trypsin-like peptidase domain-containing protein [Streptomyces syringium]|uniref:trypsin-like peptidase domain-containing protein n=1 Tax=Streptomyces syringium TaxID=76729 RepID=UPI003D89E14B